MTNPLIPDPSPFCGRRGKDTEQNAYIERFNRTVRHEWLSQYYWEDLDEVQWFATRWMYGYDHDRPNMALSGIAPILWLAMAA